MTNRFWSRTFTTTLFGLAVAGAIHAQRPEPAPLRDKDAPQAATPAPSPGQAALAQAEKDRKHLFIVFWKEDDSATQGMKQTLDAALAKRGADASSILVRVTDPAEKALVDRFGLKRSPMPMVMAFAPNGAITGGFPIKLCERDVAAAIISPGMAGCLKATQDKKLVLLCVQPADGGDALPAGVLEVEADPKYGPATEVVTVRAADPAEASLLSVFQVTPKAGVVTTVLVGTSGRRIATFEGAFTKAQVIEKLKATQGACCPGGKCG